MTNDQEFDRTFHLGEKALGFIKHNHVPAVPKNYELWYTYASGLNPALTEAIQEILKTKHHLSGEDTEQLYDLYLSANRISEQVGAVGIQISAEIEEIVSMLQAAAKSTGKFGASLNDIHKELGGIKTAERLKEVIGILITATEEMSENSQQLENKLEVSHTQIAELNTSLEAIRTESLTDPLTGIPNRKRFDQTLSHEISEAKLSGEPLCLIFTDIDFFKKFNDTYGHQTGDQVLRLVACVLKSNVKGRDLAARYGGEEFAIILPRTSLDDAKALANQIRIAIMGKELVKRSTNKKLGRVTMSFGVAQYRINEPEEVLIHRADACLYAAKAADRNQVKCEDDPDINLSINAA